MSVVDPVALAQALIRCPSVTPEDAGALDVLESALKPLGFVCHRLRFEDDNSPPIENLYAKLGTASPNFCFAGHSDVVPAGEPKLWRRDPFAAEIADGILYGRGAADMKSAIAAFVAAVARCQAEKTPLDGTISLLITGDEEGPAVNGTVKALDWLKNNGERLSHCLVGEPTSMSRTGDVIKIGRRGSMNVRVTVRGSQGHVAYPQHAVNPIAMLVALLGRLSALELDSGNEFFEPSTLAFTDLDVGNKATNIIPAEARAAFNIRFNDEHTPDSLLQMLEEQAKAVGLEYDGDIAFAHEIGGTSFVTEPGPFTELLSNAVRGVIRQKPLYSTGGGTSDARFIKNYCPVAELGLAGTTMHKADECVPVADIETLTRIYQSVLTLYFASPPR